MPSNGLPVGLAAEDQAAPAALVVLAEETLAIPVQHAVDSLVRPLVESVERETEMPSNNGAAQAGATALEVIPDLVEEPAATSASEVESLLETPIDDNLQAPSPVEISQLLDVQADAHAEPLPQLESEVVADSWDDQCGEPPAHCIVTEEPQLAAPAPEADVYQVETNASAVDLSWPEDRCLTADQPSMNLATITEQSLMAAVNAAPISEQPAQELPEALAETPSEPAPVAETQAPVESAHPRPASEETLATEEPSETVQVPHLATSEVAVAEPPFELTPAPEVSATIDIAQEPEAVAVSSSQLPLDLAPSVEPPSSPAENSLACDGPTGVLPESPAVSEVPTSSTIEPSEEPPQESAATNQALDTEAPSGIQSEPAGERGAEKQSEDIHDPPTIADSQGLGGALESHAEALFDAISTEVETEQAAIRAVASTFSEQSPTNLLPAPAEIVIAPAPPVFEWIRTPRPSFQPLTAPQSSLTQRYAQPQAPTLAGPCLPPELRNLGESLVPKRARKSGGFPSWVASLLGAMVLVVLVVLSLQYFNAQHEVKTPAPATSQAVAVTNPSADAIAKSVEISGLRLIKSWNGKQQVRFLIINHSGNDLSDVTLQVAVKSADPAAGGSPILLINAPLSSLGAYQSKEIKTDVDTEIPASALADWQALRTEIQVVGN